MKGLWEVLMISIVGYLIWGWMAVPYGYFWGFAFVPFAALFQLIVEFILGRKK